MVRHAAAAEERKRMYTKQRSSGVELHSNEIEDVQFFCKGEGVGHGLETDH